MSDTTKSPTAAGTSPKFVFDRTYRASVDELWELWTTKGGPRVLVGARGLPHGGARHRSAPKRQAALRPYRRDTRNGGGDEGNGATSIDYLAWPVLRVSASGTIGAHSNDRFSTGCRALRKHNHGRLLPCPANGCRMVVTLSPMHDQEFTKLASQGLGSSPRESGPAVSRAETSSTGTSRDIPDALRTCNLDVFGSTTKPRRDAWPR